MPLVDRRVELQPGIGRGPGGIGDSLPQIAGAQALCGLAIGAADQLPVAVFQLAFEKRVRNPHRIVRILPGDRQIGLGIPVGVIGAEIDLRAALAGELDDPADIVLRDHGAAGGAVPPDLIAPAARSPIFRKLISPDERPPPESGSPSPRIFEKFEPEPEPYLNSRASLTHRSMMPPGLTRSSATLWIKQACGCGCS